MGAWLLIRLTSPLKRSGGSFCNQPIKAEKNKSAHQRHEEARGLIWLVEAHQATEKAADEGAHNADQDGYDDAARILAGHDEFRQGTHNQADDQRPKQMEHVCSPCRSGGVLFREMPIS